MKFRTSQLDAQLAELTAAVASIAARGAGEDEPLTRAVERVQADVAATRFHLRRNHPGGAPLIVAVLGGTGTGKSTVVNRLLGVESSPLTAASFRRTYTAGPVAVAREPSDLPARWLDLDHVVLDAADLPARGRADLLSVVRAPDDGGPSSPPGGRSASRRSPSCPPRTGRAGTPAGW